jgi:hypothetical protein
MKTQETFSWDSSTYEDEAIYHIMIRGEVTDSLIHLADSLQMRRETEEDMISLIGWLPDQSSLIGLLNGLNNIRQEILLVRLISTTNNS